MGLSSLHSPNPQSQDMVPPLPPPPSSAFHSLGVGVLLPDFRDTCSLPNLALISHSHALGPITDEEVGRGFQVGGGLSLGFAQEQNGKYISKTESLELPRPFCDSRECGGIQPPLVCLIYSGSSGWVVHESGCSEEEKAGELARLSKPLIIPRRTCSQERLVFIPKAERSSTAWNAFSH